MAGVLARVRPLLLPVSYGTGTDTVTYRGSRAHLAKDAFHTFAASATPTKIESSCAWDAQRSIHAATSVTIWP